MHLDPGLAALVNRTSIALGSRWGTLISREELRVARQADALCQRVTQRRTRESATDNEDARDFHSYLLSNDGIFLRYLHQAESEAHSSPFGPWYLENYVSPLKYICMDRLLQVTSVGARKVVPVATWPGMRHDILTHSHSLFMPKSEGAGGQPPSLLHSVESRYSWEHVACDIVGSFARAGAKCGFPLAARVVRASVRVVHFERRGLATVREFPTPLLELPAANESPKCVIAPLSVGRAVPPCFALQATAASGRSDGGLAATTYRPLYRRMRHFKYCSAI